MAADILTERDARGHVKVPLPTRSRRAIVVYSGGMDSTVLLALACWSYEHVDALSFYYGQRHSCELTQARSICAAADIPHRLVSIDPSLWKQVPLVTGLGLSTYRTTFAIGNGGVPSSFVPGRNMVFLSYAMALAGLLGGADILLGANQTDAAGYPDCRPEFIDVASHAARLALPDQPTRVVAPFTGMTKTEIVALGRRLAVDFTQTWSCYRPQSHLSGVAPCGRCDACILRAEALRQA